MPVITDGWIPSGLVFWSTRQAEYSRAESWLEAADSVRGQIRWPNLIRPPVRYCWITMLKRQVLEADFARLDTGGDGSVDLEELLAGVNWDGAGASRVCPHSAPPASRPGPTISQASVLITAVKSRPNLDGHNMPGRD
jgi:hypothetical protein